MKIEARCDTCGRTFLLSQIGPDSDAPGRCPFCGARFARHYGTVFPATVREAEEASTRFVNALERLLSMETGFDLDLEGLFQRIESEVRASDDHRRAV